MEIQKLTDQELVKLSLEDAENFAFLIEKYEKSLFRYIKRLGNFPDEDAEDILQEVFIKIYQNLNDFDLKLKFSSWIYRITHNHTISFFRKSKSRPDLLSSEDSEKVFMVLSSNLDIEEKIDQNLEKDKIRELLNQLDKKYRDVLILKFLEDKDYNEISDILRKPVGTISTLINRAKIKFKELLIKYKIYA